MKRLNQLVTRLLIIALVLLAAWIGRAHFAKRSLIYHLESSIGARVEARQLQIKDDGATVFLNEVEIADPTNVRKNLIQFEAASLQFDLSKLKQRRIVIENGRLSQIKFGTPRTTSGRLEKGIFDPIIPDQPFVETVNTEAGIPLSDSGFSNASAARRWQDGVVVDFKQNSTPPEASFQIIPLLNEKTMQWNDRFREPHQRMIQIQRDLAMVEEVLSVPYRQRNPLRDQQSLKEATAAAQAARESLSKIGGLISKFESTSQKDAYELSQAQIRDRQSLVSGIPMQKFDHGLVNELLLGEIQRELVANGLQWFQDFRNSIPDPETDFRPLTRGRDVLFGTKAKPSFEIRQLQIDGSAEFANAHFKFAGTVENIFSDPDASELPMKFNLRAQGDPQVVIAGEVNRASGQKLESVQFTGHSIPQPARVLGNSESVQISMSRDSQLFVEANLAADEFDRINGQITFNFENVMLHADSVHELAGGTETAARINETVSGIESFQIVARLGGTITQPTTAFVSDLGPQVATSLESVFNDAQQLALKKRELRLNRTVEGELEKLKADITGGIAKLNELWRANYSRLNKLDKSLGVAGGSGAEKANWLRRQASERPLESRR
jgi:hypothetical protein